MYWIILITEVQGLNNSIIKLEMRIFFYLKNNIYNVIKEKYRRMELKIKIKLGMVGDTIQKGACKEVGLMVF